MSEIRHVTITLIHAPRTPWARLAGGRWQPWRWVAKAANGRILATSSESYTNRADAVEAIWLLFAASSEARIVHDDGSHYLLRGADLGDDDWPILGEVLG